MAKWQRRCAVETVGFAEKTWVDLPRKPSKAPLYNSFALARMRRA